MKKCLKCGKIKENNCFVLDRVVCKMCESKFVLGYIMDNNIG